MIERIAYAAFQFAAYLYGVVASWPWQADIGLLLVLSVGVVMARQMAGGPGEPWHAAWFTVVSVIVVVEAAAALMMLWILLTGMFPWLGSLIP